MMVRLSVVALLIAPLLLKATSAVSAENPWEAEAEAGLLALTEQIRTEDVDSGACGSPPQAPRDISDKAGRRFYNAVQTWDRCKRSHVDDLEDRVADYQYQLDNWLPDLPADHPLAERAFRTIDIYNQRVGRARERAQQDYQFLASAEAEYADNIDTAIRKETWARIAWEQKISDYCMSWITAHFGPYSETLYECIQRAKYEQRLIEAGYSPYTPYNPHPHNEGYEHIKIVVKVDVDGDRRRHD